MAPRDPSYRRQVLMLGVAALTGAGVAATGAPAGWLSGAMIGTAIMAVLGWAVPLAPGFRWAAMILAGLVVGSSASPEVLASIASFPSSIMLMLASVAATTVICVGLLARGYGWGRNTALFAAVPGALSYVMLAAAEDPNVDSRRVALVQVLRVFLLMGLAPLIVAESGAIFLKMAAPTAPLWIYLSMAPVAALFGAILERVKMAAGLLFAAMLVSAMASATGLAQGRPPAIIAIGAQILLGLWIGARFVNLDLWRLRQWLAPAFAVFILGMAVCTAAAWSATQLFHAPFALAMLAYAPGGLEAMTLLAFALGLNPLFVAAHHLVRFVAISVAVPIALRFCGDEREGPPTKEGKKS